MAVGRASILVLLGTLSACGGSEPECAIRCGDRCLTASACDAESSCPANAQCDPCTGQCRATCTQDTGCKNPSLTCCTGGGTDGTCVDLTADTLGCGACGNACGVDTDRCENGACTCGDLGHACGKGSLCCGGACVLADATQCGACGVACDPGETCDAITGACRCGDKSKVGASACGASASCCGATCTPTSTDPKNCGGCGLVCVAGQKCIDSHCDCSSAGCADPAQTCCGGRCASLQIDPSYCGACGVSCGTGEVCGGGSCACGSTVGKGGPACAAGETCCGSACKKLTTDVTSCGACGVNCGAGETCVAGKCTCGSTSRAGAACLGGTRCCGTQCVSLSTDPANCGGCNNVCDAQRSDECFSGGCICAAGSGLCPASQHCTVLGCVCDGTVCAGCCGNNVCQGQSTAACGANGSACMTCDTVRANICNMNGSCGCSTSTGGAQCAVGKHCSMTGCVCDGTVCPNGCCDSTGSCVPYASESKVQCGAGGVACASCGTGESCTMTGQCLCTDCNSSACCGHAVGCDGHMYNPATGDPVSGIQSTCKTDGALPGCGSITADGSKYFTSRGRVEACVSLYKYNGATYNATGYAYIPAWSSYSVDSTRGGCAADPYNEYDVCDAICAPVINYKATCDATTNGNWNTGPVPACPANPCP